jgi:hypothetical protein
MLKSSQKKAREQQLCFARATIICIFPRERDMNPLSTHQLQFPLVDQNPPPPLNPTQESLSSQVVGSSPSNNAYIRDDNGYAWYFDTELKRIVSMMDVVQGIKGSGYPCLDLQEGVEILNKMGYITGTVEEILGLN